MTAEEFDTLQREAEGLRRAYVGHLDNLSGDPTRQRERMALAERYKEIEQQLDSSTRDTPPDAPPLPSIYAGETDKDVMGETAAEEMILRMEAWNIRLCLRKIRSEKPLDTEAVEAFQKRYTALNALLETTRYRDTDFCATPELAPESQG